MDVRTKLLLNRFRNNEYSLDMYEYLKENVNNKLLSYDNLKFLYDYLYKDKSSYIRQNIYPVSEFLMVGYSTNEALRVASLLPDASNYTIYSDKRYSGDIFNKLFQDLRFAYQQYNVYIKANKTQDTALSIIVDEFEYMDKNQREYHLRMDKNEIKDVNELAEYYKGIEKEMRHLRADVEKMQKAAGIRVGIHNRKLEKDNSITNNETLQEVCSKEILDKMDRYTSLGATLTRIEDYTYTHYLENEDEEMEY